MMLTEAQKETIKATIPVLEEHGATVTTHFYNTLFEDHPELLHVFNHVHQKTGMQPRALAYSLYQAAVHIDRLEAISPFVERVAHKHRSIGVRAEHYPLVGEYLLRAMQEKLNLEKDHPVIEAWGAAYGVIADIFIETEKKMYEDAGWDGFEELEVVEKRLESSEITSFYVKRANGKPLPPFEPGQYISIMAQIPGEQYTHIRQYSLSDQPDTGYYRISVKRESGPDGIVSSWLHDSVRVGSTLPASAPAGDFTVKSSPAPAVFIAGGVGITPLLSMMKQQKKAEPERPMTLIHAVRDGRTAGLTAETKDWATAPHKRFLVIEHPAHSEDGDAQGRLTADTLRRFMPEQPADVYLCGPEAFMQTAAGLLSQTGVPDDRIHYEFFGPGTALEPAMAEEY
ncbi:NO-inducible flavohemoprotein [Alkalicoccus luteus]|nr:NO-inducible flavohemoprotein [Alkalicoccus luteus]